MSATITWGDDLRLKIIRRRQALRCAALVLFALPALGAGLFEPLAALLAKTGAGNGTSHHLP
jgi:hypothetical protein